MWWLLSSLAMRTLKSLLSIPQTGNVHAGRRLLIMSAYDLSESKDGCPFWAGYVKRAAGRRDESVHRISGRKGSRWGPSVPLEHAAGASPAPQRCRRDVVAVRNDSTRSEDIAHAEGAYKLSPRSQCPGLLPLAGFQVTLIGRFWVTPEEIF
jgi:hypothetical protein